MLDNPRVKCLVVNFCGAFARTDVMTGGVLDAWEALAPPVPVFFSVHGTGSTEARTMLRERLGVVPYATMDEAIAAAVVAAPGRGRSFMIVRGDQPVLVQGITGKQGTFWTERMQAYGTRIVAGVNPKKAGTVHCGVPVHASAREAMREVGFDVSVLFIPPLGVKAAASRRHRKPGAGSSWWLIRTHPRAGRDGGARGGAGGTTQPSWAPTPPGW